MQYMHVAHTQSARTMQQACTRTHTQPQTQLTKRMGPTFLLQLINKTLVAHCSLSKAHAKSK